MFVRHLPALRRHTLVGLAIAAALCTTSSLNAQQPPAPQQPAPPAGQQPPAGQPPAAQAPAAPAAPSLAFSGDSGLVLFTIKAEGVADFEAFFAKVKEALEKGTKPEYKQMASGWKMYRVTDGAGPGDALYAAVVDPAVKSADYDPVKILGDVLPDDARALYPKLAAAIKSVNKLNLTTSMKMGS